MKNINLYLKVILLITCYILAFPSTDIQAQCDSSPPECQPDMMVGHGTDPCMAKVYCSNSGAVESGLINCTNSADTDGCGIDASDDAVDDITTLEFANADMATMDLFDSGTCSTGNYLQWMVLATPPYVKGTKIQAVGAVDSWWVFHAGSFTSPGEYTSVLAALSDPARCENFDASNLITCSDNNQWETWTNNDSDIGPDLYNVYYIALFYDAPTNGSLNFKVKECESCPENTDCDDEDCNTADSYDVETCMCVNTPIPPPDCDDNDCNTADSYDDAICECVNTPIPPPDCDDNDCNTADSYDDAICECVNTPIPPPDCDDNDCNTADSYDDAICECVNTPIPPPDCDDNDCNTADSYDDAICECVNTPDPTARL